MCVPRRLASHVVTMASTALTPELLGQPARHVARAFARDRLRKTLEEAARLEISPRGADAVEPVGGAVLPDDDPEAVHDFRVALRRLRTWLRAFRPLLDDAVTRDTRRRLRRLWRLAGDARDLQVQHAWLTDATSGLNSAAMAQARSLAAEFAPSVARAQRKLTRRVVKDLPRASAELAGRLERERRDVGALSGAGTAMSAAMARLLRTQLEELQANMIRLRRRRRLELAHPVRIAAKRLRYLLDAFERSSRLATAATRRLAALQDVFGDLHDAQVLARRIGATSGQRNRRASSLEVAVRRRVDTTFRRVRQLSRSGELTAVHAATDRLIRQLERRASGARLRSLRPKAPGSSRH